MSGIEPAVAVTAAATLELHGGLLHKEIDNGFWETTSAVSDAGITLPVVRHIGKRDETDVGMEMGLS